jgi:hypothetical protein
MEGMEERLAAWVAVAWAAWTDMDGAYEMSFSFNAGRAIDLWSTT